MFDQRQRNDPRASLRRRKVLGPPLEQLHPPCKSLPPVVCPRNLIIVCMIKSEFDHITLETLISSQGGERAAPAVG